MIGQTLAHYRIVSKLGSGGMSEVYLAEDSLLDRRVALKLLPPRLAADAARLALFENEARTLAALNHPGITTIYSVERHGELNFFTMELVEGDDLGALIAAGGLPLDRLLPIAIPLTEALAAAHQRGVFHRDLKPAHVMVTRDGRVKILDFGLASLRRRAGDDLRDDEVTAPLVGDRAAGGTIPYMAPEQLRGESSDHLSDIYSLGVVLFEMATGQRPFRGSSPAALVSSILRDAPQPPDRLRPELPDRLARLIARCLDKDPRSRPQTALDVLSELEQAGGDEAPSERRPIRSVAVLPFADSSPSQDQEYFCDGIAEELTNALTRIEDLRVASRTSAFQFRGLATDVREIGRKLNVDALLEGSVRKSGDRLRITADLVTAADGFRLWSKRFDRRMKDIFEIQDEIAGSIVDALRVTLGPHERRKLQRPTTSVPGAYEFYLRGRQYFNQYSRHGMEFALDMYSRAIALDDSYALAHAGIADCCAFLYANAERRPEHIERALAASRLALDLEPELAEAHVSHGVALSYGGRPELAEAAFKAAIRLNPRLFEAHYFYARHCFIVGEHEHAIRLYERASVLRPEDYQSMLLVAQILDDLDRVDEARAARRRGVQRAEERLRTSPDDSRALYMGANGLVALGEQDKGLSWARRARELSREDPMTLYNLACIHSLAGEIDVAIECLEDCLRHGFSNHQWIERDSNLDKCRTHPRFKALIERVEPGSD